MGDIIKVLWFCNALFSDKSPNSSGTWLYSMSEALINTGEIDLYNITQGKVKELVRRDYGSIKQWVVPKTKQRRLSNDLSNTYLVQNIQEIVEYVKPDIIHIWGTEVYWGLLTARNYICGPTILEIQGLKYAIEKYYTAGLSVLDVLMCTGFREVLIPTSSIHWSKYNFKRWGQFEKEIIAGHKYISTQSNWSRAHIKSIYPTATIIKTLLSLRPEYIRAGKWVLDKAEPNHIFTLASATTPYKGLHVLVDAMAILKKQHPTIKLTIAGTTPKRGIKKAGYTKWLERKIKHYNLTDNVSFTGHLNAEEIILELKKARVFIHPSFVESYSLALDEALSIGMPTVASFSGAMPEMATHEHSALFYTPGDAVMCANAIERILNDDVLADKLSENAYKARSDKNSRDIAQLQLSIYKEILEATSI